MSGNSSSSGSGKHKCQFENVEPSKKACGEELLYYLGKKGLPARNPALDCECDQGTGTITVRDPKSYRGKPEFTVNECGYFSVDGERIFRGDHSQLKYLHLPENVLRLNWDLNIGYENVVKKIAQYEKLDMMLQWIITNKAKFLGQECGEATLLKSLPVDFVCFRGLLTVLFATPYEKQDDWIICATKFKGTIYLCAFPTESRIRHEETMTEHHKLMCSWGYKFEQYLTRRQLKGKPESPDTPVNENEEFCAVFSSKLNNNNLLYGAEMDAVVPSSYAKYIELKTSRFITTEIQDIKFCKYKMLKWWAQCCLASVNKLYCGFRDDYGIIHYMRSFNVFDIPTFGEGLWAPSACFNFCNCFLSFAKKMVVKDDPDVVYQFDWTPGSQITCQELHTSVFPEKKILADWFTAHFEV